MSRNSTDQIVDELEAEFRDWEVWASRRFLGGDVWHARRRDDGLELEEDSAEQLAEAMSEIEEQEQEQGSWWAQ